MKKQDVVNYILLSPLSINWRILENMIFTWKDDEHDNPSERFAGLIHLNKVQNYISKNSGHINPTILNQLLLEIEEIIEKRD